MKRKEAICKTSIKNEAKSKQKESKVIAGVIVCIVPPSNSNALSSYSKMGHYAVHVCAKAIIGGKRNRTWNSGVWSCHTVANFRFRLREKALASLDSTSFTIQSEHHNLFHLHSVFVISNQKKKQNKLESTSRCR